MRRGFLLASGLASLFLAAEAGEARAQWGYPRGYGGYGWSQWGQDPGAGYMAGLGSFARGRGQYEVDAAQAKAINLETMLKYNKALRARQREVAKEKQAADAKKLAADNALARQDLIDDGTSLNVLLDQIFEFNDGGTKAYASKAPLTPSLVRDIPFEVQSEALTVCLDQMTARDGWPDDLNADRLVARRQAVSDAVDAAVAEDMKGDVSSDTVAKLNAAVAALRAEYEKKVNVESIEYAQAEAFLNTLGGLSGSLQNPKFKEIVKELAEYKEGDIGDLVGFMQAFNLRFAPATSDRQKEIYRRLYPMFVAVLKETGGSPETFTNATDATGKGFRDAAVGAFTPLKPTPAK